MRRISSIRGTRHRFSGTSLADRWAGRCSEGQDFRVRQLRGVPAEPAPDFGGVCARTPASRAAAVRQRSAASEFVADRSGSVAPDFNGIAEVFSSPLQTIREDFGTVRVDHVFSHKDTLSGIYTIDDGDDFTATAGNPYSSDVVTLREQVFSLEETHVFSPTLAEYGARWLFARRIFLHRRANAGNTRGQRPGIFGGAPGRRGGGGRQRGFESAGAAGLGGKQQRKQSDDRAQFVYV